MAFSMFFAPLYPCLGGVVLSFGEYVLVCRVLDGRYMYVCIYGKNPGTQELWISRPSDRRELSYISSFMVLQCCQPAGFEPFCVASVVGVQRVVACVGNLCAMAWIPIFEDT